MAPTGCGRRTWRRCWPGIKACPKRSPRKKRRPPEVLFSSSGRPFYRFKLSDRVSALQLAILLVADRLTPLVFAVLTGDLHGDVAEPAVRLGPVPVLHVGGDHDDAARLQADGGLALLLIPALAGGTQQQLAAAFCRVVDVPVVAALNWTPPPQSLVVASFNGIHICALCESFLTSSFYQVIFLFLPRSKPLLQG